MNIQAVLFDHDGTLVDSESTHLQLWRAVLARFDVHLSDREYWQTLLGVPAKQNADILVRTKGLAVSADYLVAEKVRITAAFLENQLFPAIEGSDQLLRDVARHVPIALVSGAQEFCIQASLQGYGWQALFTSIVTGDDVTRNKPNPQGYQQALAQLGVTPEYCVALEDSESGVRAAHGAGIPVLAIRNRWSAGHDFSLACAEVADLDEARRWLMTRLA